MPKSQLLKFTLRNSRYLFQNGDFGVEIQAKCSKRLGFVITNNPQTSPMAQNLQFYIFKMPKSQLLKFAVQNSRYLLRNGDFGDEIKAKCSKRLGFVITNNPKTSPKAQNLQFYIFRMPKSQLLKFALQNSRYLFQNGDFGDKMTAKCSKTLVLSLQTIHRLVQWHKIFAFTYSECQKSIAEICSPKFQVSVEKWRFW